MTSKSHRAGDGNIPCPKCGGRTRVVETAGDGTGREVYRIRKCKREGCGERVDTTERAA
jgi:transcriptional regulator NrdR family protein